MPPRPASSGRIVLPVGVAQVLLRRAIVHVGTGYFAAVLALAALGGCAQGNGELDAGNLTTQGIANKDITDPGPACQTGPPDIAAPCPDDPAPTPPDDPGSRPISANYDEALGFGENNGGKPPTPRIAALHEDIAGKRLAPRTQADDAAAKRAGPRAEMSLANLPEAIAYAVLTFPEIKIHEARVREARAAISVASAGLYPTAEARIATGSSFSGAYNGQKLPYANATNATDGRLDGSIVLKQLLFDFGATRSDIDRASFLRDSERHKMREKIDEIAYKTAQLYTRILELRSVVRLVDETIGAHQQLLGIVEAQAREGQGTLADVNRVKSRLVDVNAIRSDVSLQLHGAEDQFERLTRNRPGKLVAVPDFRRHLPRDSQDAIVKAMANNPRLAGMVATRNSVQKELDFQKASNLPRISLEVETDSQNYRNQALGHSQLDARAMVAMRFKLFDGGLGKASEEQIAARIQGTEMGLLNEREQLEADLRQAYRAIESAGSKGRLLADGVRAATSVRELYLEQFKGGKRTIFELLDGQMSYYTARRSQIESQFEIARGVFNILRGTGEITRVLANSSPSAGKGASGRARPGKSTPPRSKPASARPAPARPGRT